jgi:putative peptidoglycan lipid II flippase
MQAGWLPHGGLALANSTATGLEAAVLWWLMRRRLGGLEGRRLLLGAGQAGAAALAMAAGVWAWLALAGNAPAWIGAAGGILVGAGVYAGGALALGVGEARWMARLAWRRLAR